jgi:hypothetical protein
MSIIQLKKLLSSGIDDRLGKLICRAQDMDRLAKALKSGLETELGSHLVAANLRPDGTLVVLADGPAWAARLRYETPRILKIATGTGRVVESCRVAVAREHSESAGTG